MSLRILLTGFGPFPGVEHNASGDLVKHLSLQDIKQHRLIPHIFTCTWDHVGTETIQLFEKHQPHISLHFGVSAKATGLQLETRAFNECCTSPDAAGINGWGRALSPSDVPCRTTHFPVQKLYEHLSGLGYPASLSDDAGRYLCNFLYYQTLSQCILSPQKILSLFIHIPVCPEAHIFAGAAEILFFAIREVPTYISKQQ